MAEHANSITPQRPLSTNAERWRHYAGSVWNWNRREYLMAVSVAIQQGYEPGDLSMLGQSLIKPFTVQLFMRDGGVCYSSGDFGAPPEIMS